MTHDPHLRAVLDLFGFLGVEWFITGPCLLLAAFGLWEMRRARPSDPFVTYRPVALPFLWPLAAVIIGAVLAVLAVLADLVEQAGSVGIIKGMMVVPTVLLLGGIGHYLLVIRSEVRLRRLAGFCLPLFLWLALATAVMCMVAITGFGRQWH